MTRPGLSRDTHLFNPTWPPRMWSQQLVVIVKARAEASSPGRASKSESELLNWTSSTRESCSPSLPFMGWDCPTLFLAVWLCWLLSSSWKSPPRLKFHVCVHEPIQARVRSRFCTLFPISLSISFFHPCHLPNEIDWYPAWHRLNANYIQGSPSGGPQPAAIMPGLTREISLFLAFHSSVEAVNSSDSPTNKRFSGPSINYFSSTKVRIKNGSQNEARIWNSSTRGRKPVCAPQMVVSTWSYVSHQR